MQRAEKREAEEEEEEEAGVGGGGEEGGEVGGRWWWWWGVGRTETAGVNPSTHTHTHTSSQQSAPLSTTYGNWKAHLLVPYHSTLLRENYCS